MHSGRKLKLLIVGYKLIWYVELMKSFWIIARSFDTFFFSNYKGNISILRSH